MAKKYVFDPQFTYTAEKKEGVGMEEAKKLKRRYFKRERKQLLIKSI